jgi:hypothetical protein
MTVDHLGAARTSYEAEGQWTSPVLFTPADITRFLDATERIPVASPSQGVSPCNVEAFGPRRTPVSH